MERVNRIILHPDFQYHLDANNRAEADRRFCHHNMGHFLDVARIGWMLVLEEELLLEKEVVYAAALLHDMGKHIQYEDGTPHERAGAEIAPRILADCGFSQEEQQCIVDAILSHRDSKVIPLRNLQSVLYRADKASRACFYCEAEQECNWKSGNKNRRLRY